MRVKLPGKQKKYIDMVPLVQDILHSTCCDAHVTGGRGDTQKHDPMLKLYVGCPVMLTENQDVKNSLANGSMCTFVGVELKNGKGPADMGYVSIDGYYVRSIDASDVKYIVLELQENKIEGQAGKTVKLKPKRITCKARFPFPSLLETRITHRTKRENIKIQLTQIPVNISNARTVHKLQGRSIDNLFVSCLNYTDNWIYVALSRVKTSKGLFLRHKINRSRVKPMKKECKDMYTFFRKTKTPKN
jgi:hypothetical protein